MPVIHCVWTAGALALLSGAAAAEPLRLQDALERALAEHPALEARAYDGPIAEAGVLQAGLRPNPEIALEIENIGAGAADAEGGRQSFGADASGSLSAGAEWSETRTDGGAFDESELTLRLSQLIELGGKRAARLAAARRAESVAAWDYEAARYEIAGAVVVRFAGALAAQERLRQAESLAALGGRLADTVAGQAEAGSVAPLQARRARAEAATLDTEAQTASGELNRALVRLAALWGATTPDFQRVAGAVDALPPLPTLDAVLARRAEHPILARWDAEIERRRAEAALEDARGVPDLTLTLGYRAQRRTGADGRSFGLGTDGAVFARTWERPGDDWTHSFLAEASIPIPVFDRNQGARKEAALRAQQAAAEKRAAGSRIETALAEQHAAAAAARDAAESLANRVLPDLETTYTLTEEGYERGKFDFLAVLEAERALAEARLAETEARIAYHAALAQIERIAGLALPAPAVEPEAEPTLKPNADPKEVTP